MAKLNVTIRVKDSDGTTIPLQRNFVEHIWGGLYITDDEGRVCDGVGNLGIETSDEEIDIRVLLQNSVVKHQDMYSWKDWKVSDGDTKTLRTSNTEHIDKFRVLNHCVKVYDKVFRQFEVFSTSSRGDFPLGSSGSLSTKKDRWKRIGLDFPSGFPFADLSFTEPKALFSDYPILHIRADDNRLFGTNGRQRTLIASELAHALHFSDLTIFQRGGIQDHYLGWLIGQSASGEPPTHGLDVMTTPLIAFIEALDHFSSHFFAFVLANPNDPINSDFRNRFIESELNATADDGSKLFCDFSGNLHTGTVSNPKFMGASTEGAIYGALFLDFARRFGIGLKTVVNAFFRSKALTTDDFITWIIENKPELRDELVEVANTWGFGPLVNSSLIGADMEVTCINKIPRADRYNHIKFVGGTNHRTGTTFRMSQRSCISYINAGANFFVQGPDGRVPVRVITKEQPTVGLTTYIATEADETRSNNLLSLPEC